MNLDRTTAQDHTTMDMAATAHQDLLHSTVPMVLLATDLARLYKS